MFQIQARIQAIEPIDEELVYLDQVLDIPFTEGYEDNPDAPLQDHDAPLSHLMASMKITHPSSDHCQSPLPIYPCKDNFDTLREIGRCTNCRRKMEHQDKLLIPTPYYIRRKMAKTLY